MKFVMQIDKVVSTALGHTIEFKKGVPTHVPKDCWRDVQAAGAIPEDPETAQQAQVAAPPKPVVDDPEVRQKAIFMVFEKMVEGNKRNDFTAAGVPAQKRLVELVGFDVDVKERDRLWDEFRQGKDN